MLLEKDLGSLGERGDHNAAVDNVQRLQLQFLRHGSETQRPFLMMACFGMNEGALQERDEKESALNTPSVSHEDPEERGGGGRAKAKPWVGEKAAKSPKQGKAKAACKKSGTPPSFRAKKAVTGHSTTTKNKSFGSACRTSFQPKISSISAFTSLMGLIMSQQTSRTLMRCHHQRRGCVTHPTRAQAAAPVQAAVANANAATILIP